MAVGLATAGVGAGTFILPPLVGFLFEKFGFSGAFFILGGLSLNFCVVAMLYRPLFVHRRIVLGKRGRGTTGKVLKSVSGSLQQRGAFLTRDNENSEGVEEGRQKPAGDGSVGDDATLFGCRAALNPNAKESGAEYPVQNHDGPKRSQRPVMVHRPSHEPERFLPTQKSQTVLHPADSDASCSPPDVNGTPPSVEIVLNQRLWDNKVSGAGDAQSTTIAEPVEVTTGLQASDTDNSEKDFFPQSTEQVQHLAAEAHGECSSHLLGQELEEDSAYERYPPPATPLVTKETCEQSQHADVRCVTVMSSPAKNSVDESASLSLATRKRKKSFSTKPILSGLKTCFPVERRAENSQAKRKMLDWSLLRHPAFMFYCFSICLFTASMKSSLVFLPPLVKSKGVSEIEAAYLLSISGKSQT